MSRSARPAAGAGPGAKKKVTKLDSEQLEELKEAFNLFDTDNNGKIDAKELKAAMRALGFQVKKSEVRKMINDLTKDDAGTIEYDDFVEIMTGRMGDRDSKDEIAKVFALFDPEGNGKISFRELKVRYPRLRPPPHTLGEQLSSARETSHCRRCCSSAFFFSLPLFSLSLSLSCLFLFLLARRKAARAPTHPRLTTTKHAPTTDPCSASSPNLARTSPMTSSAK